MKQVIRDHRGSLLIEVLISVAIVATFSLALASLAQAHVTMANSARMRSQAVALARETLEEVLAIEREGWTGVKKDNGFYKVSTVATGDHFVLESSVSTGEPVDSTFQRILWIEKGRRDGDAHGRLNQAGSYVDENVRLATVTVSWDDRGQHRDIELSTYLMNWREAT